MLGKCSTYGLQSTSIDLAGLSCPVYWKTIFMNLEEPASQSFSQAWRRDDIAFSPGKAHLWRRKSMAVVFSEGLQE